MERPAQKINCEYKGVGAEGEPEELLWVEGSQIG